MNVPPDLGYWFQRLDHKLDTIDSKIDEHNATLATHGVRITTLEGDVKEIRSTKADETKTLSSGRQALLSGVVAAVIGGLFTILPLVVK